MARSRVTHIDGIETVRAAFKTLKNESIGRITHALNLGADEVVSGARILAPIDEGDLKATIRKTPIQLKGGKFGGVVIRIIAGNTKQTANAAFRSEFGRDPGGTFKKGPKAGQPTHHPGHDPQEFMFPAYWAVRRRIKARVATAVRNAAKAAVQSRGK